MTLGNVLANWILVGSLYAAVALGFSLVWGIMNIVNLAHGAFILVGAYVSYWMFVNLHIDPFVGLLATMLVLFVMGYIIQFVAINRVIRAPLLVTFLFTFGLNLLIADTLQHVFTSDFKSVNLSYAGAGFDLGDMHISLLRAISAFVAIALTIVLAIFLARTRLGNAILATGMDRDAARLMGINIAQIYAITFGLGAALAGAAGVLFAELGQFSPTQGGIYTLRAFVVVVLGGLGSPLAVIAGGLLFGLAETVVPLIPGLGAGYDNLIAFAVFVLVLIIRPRGLFGKATYV